MSEDRLERALGAWAAANALTDRERERTRIAILLTPQVDEVWWARFAQQMDRIAARAQRPLTTPRVSTLWA